jgi:hypothetical protein
MAGTPSPFLPSHEAAEPRTNVQQFPILRFHLGQHHQPPVTPQLKARQYLQPRQLPQLAHQLPKETSPVLSPSVQPQLIVATPAPSGTPSYPYTRDQNTMLNKNAVTVIAASAPTATLKKNIAHKKAKRTTKNTHNTIASDEGKVSKNWSLKKGKCLPRTDDDYDVWTLEQLRRECTARGKVILRNRDTERDESVSYLQESDLDRLLLQTQVDDEIQQTSFQRQAQTYPQRRSLCSKPARSR